MNVARNFLDGGVQLRDAGGPADLERQIKRLWSGNPLPALKTM
jgi:hypothetical protein